MTLRVWLMLLGVLDAMGTAVLALAPTNNVQLPGWVALLIGVCLVGIQVVTTNLRSWQDAAKRPETPATETPQVVHRHEPHG